jgi:DNA-binding PadR family transcriptional regulator
LQDTIKRYIVIYMQIKARGMLPFTNRFDCYMQRAPRKRGGRRGVSGRGSDESFAERSPWYGRGGFGFGGGGGGRIFGPGDLRLMLLALIEEKPRHGYELIKEIEQKFGGGYSPSPGSIYPTLTLLEELGHVRATASEGAKKLFEITAQGREFLAENKATIDGITARMGLAARAMSRHAPPVAIFEAMHTLKAALMLHRGNWSEAEIKRVRQIIEKAAHDISGDNDE